jgi:hypothetical protein
MEVENRISLLVSSPAPLSFKLMGSCTIRLIGQIHFHEQGRTSATAPRWYITNNNNVGIRRNCI